MRKLDPSVKKVWMVKLGALWTLVVLGVSFYEATHLFSRGDGWLPPGVLLGVTVLLGVSITLVVPRLRYRYWRFDVREEELFLEYGIFNRVWTVVPLRRIQHLDVSQDLLEREFSLGKLIVHTAGARSSDVVVPGLRLEEAEQLRDDLRHYITEDAV